MVAQLEKPPSWMDRLGGDMHEVRRLLLAIIGLCADDIKHAREEVSRLEDRRNGFIRVAHEAGVQRKYVLEAAGIGGQQHSNIIKGKTGKEGT